MAIQTKKRKILMGLMVLCLGLLLAAIACIFLPGLPQGLALPLLLVGVVGMITLLLMGRSVHDNLTVERDHYRDHDALTGLPNEQVLQQDYERLKDRTGQAFLIFRLNVFDRLLSLFGIKAGGEIVCRIAEQMKKFAASRNGTAYRTAIDQFIMLFPSHSEAELQISLDQFFRELEQVHVLLDQVAYSYHYTFSYAAYRMAEQDNSVSRASQLSGYLQLMLGQVQKEGMTSGVLLSQNNRPNWDLQAELGESIQEAWRQRQIVPYYQMIYDLNTGKPVGAELLTRWIHPTRGVIMPGQFLPVIEEHGLTLDLDLYMLEEACRKIKGWMDQELVTVPLSVNISKLNIHRQDFVEKVLEVVEKYNIPPVLLELELTESVLLFEKNDTFIELTNVLHDYGFSLSMDHFADNDLSSVNLLRELPLDVVKVSANFFANAEKEGRERIFATHVLRMLKEMKVKIIVMGVETEEQAQQYRSIGCGYAQGYYFSRPISNEEFEKQIF